MEKKIQILGIHGQIREVALRFLIGMALSGLERISGPIRKYIIITVQSVRGGKRGQVHIPPPTKCFVFPLLPFLRISISSRLFSPSFLFLSKPKCTDRKTTPAQYHAYPFRIFRCNILSPTRAAEIIDHAS